MEMKQVSRDTPLAEVKASFVSSGHGNRLAADRRWLGLPVKVRGVAGNAEQHTSGGDAAAG